MSLKSNYTINQVLTTTMDDLISNGALGSYCKINLNNYTDPQLFITGITTPHITSDKVFTLFPSIDNIQVYVNKNNYYLLFTSLLITDFGATVSGGSGNEYRWLIFENTPGSSVQAMTDASGSLTSDFLTSNVWFSGPTLSSGLYKIVYDVQTYPIYNKPWTRWRPPCVRCPGQGMLCNSQYSQTDLDMRRKAEVLLYRKNAMPISRKLNWAQAVKIAKKRKNKNTYASQSVSYTNPNTQNLVRIDNKLIVNPRGFSILAAYASIIPSNVLGNFCKSVSDFEILLYLPAAYTQPEYITTPQKFYFSYKNTNNVYLTSVDDPAKGFNISNKFKIGIIFDSSGNLIASCKYNIEIQNYTTASWSVQQGNLKHDANIVSDGNCNVACKAPPLPPTFSNVPGKGPNLYMDPNIPLTQYITRRTYKGTAENVTRLFSAKGVQGRWDDYPYEKRRPTGGGGGAPPEPIPVQMGVCSGDGECVQSSYPGAPSCMMNCQVPCTSATAVACTGLYTGQKYYCPDCFRCTADDQGRTFCSACADTGCAGNSKCRPTDPLSSSCPVPPPMYKCDTETGHCIADTAGTQTQPQCSAACKQTMYTCDTTTGQCTQDPEGTLTQAQCSAACKQTPASWSGCDCTDLMETCWNAVRVGGDGRYFPLDNGGDYILASTSGNIFWINVSYNLYWSPPAAPGTEGVFHGDGSSSAPASCFLTKGPLPCSHLYIICEGGGWIWTATELWNSRDLFGAGWEGQVAAYGTGPPPGDPSIPTYPITFWFASPPHSN